MFTITSSILISAPVNIVWQVITNTQYYKDWNSQLEFWGGNLKENEKIHLKLKPKGGTAYEFKPKVIKLIPEKEFSWLASTGFKGIFDGQHHFLLTKKSERETILTNYEKYSGILSPIMKRLPMMKNAQQGFDLMNNEIKCRAEAVFFKKNK